MSKWIKQHQKKLSLSLGVLLTIGAVASLFWSNVDSSATDEERLAAANVARMEARIGTQTGSSQKVPDRSLLSSNYHEKQQEQLRYAIIIFLLFGVGFVGYGLLKKEEKS